MRVLPTDIDGCFLIERDVFPDSRGTFMESYNQAELERSLNQPISFVQDNQSVSHKNVLRGLHFQRAPYAQAKFVEVVRGAVRDVVVDLRVKSPTFKKLVIADLSEENRRALFIPRGLAHGFVALKDQTVFRYKCDSYYHPEAEGGIIYNDPDLQIDWGIDEQELIVSEKDRVLPRLNQLYP